MAQHRATGTPDTRPRAASAEPARHAQLTVTGVTKEAISAASLFGSSVPKGPLSPALGAQHASDGNTLVTDEAFAQVDIASALAAIDALSTARGLRASARSAEAVSPTAESVSVESPRLLAHGRGPSVYVLGMVAGDIARAVAMFTRYGYTVNRAFVPPRLDVMTHYSYWQLTEASVLGNLPQSAREAVAAAFSRGVTIWNTVSEIGTEPANAPVAGVSY